MTQHIFVSELGMLLSIPPISFSAFKKYYANCTESYLADKKNVIISRAFLKGFLNDLSFK